jgi:hypothetical protein
VNDKHYCKECENLAYGFCTIHKAKISGHARACPDFAKAGLRDLSSERHQRKEIQVELAQRNNPAAAEERLLHRKKSKTLFIPAPGTAGNTLSERSNSPNNHQRLGTPRRNPDAFSRTVPSEPDRSRPNNATQPTTAPTPTRTVGLKQYGTQEVNDRLLDLYLVCDEERILLRNRLLRVESEVGTVIRLLEALWYDKDHNAKRAVLSRMHNLLTVIKNPP